MMEAMKSEVKIIEELLSKLEGLMTRKIED